ncbi:MAG: hypothetical protein J6B81_00020 [Spirochaetaceae bacterium]|nr:hypothetical protein [Spirochaetaceae bacterium]
MKKINVFILLFVFFSLTFLLCGCGFVFSGISGSASYTFVNQLRNTSITQIRLEPIDGYGMFSSKIHSCRISYGQSTIINGIANGNYRIYVTIDEVEYLANKGTELIVNDSNGSLQIKYKQQLQAKLQVTNNTGKALTEIAWSEDINFSEESKKTISIRSGATVTIDMPEGNFYLKFFARVNNYQSDEIVYKNQYNVPIQVYLEKENVEAIVLEN